MAIVLSDNIQNNAPKPTDSRYLCNQVPYTSVGQANSVIAGGTGGVRYTGLTVNINGEEYWYKNGIDDGDLIPKVLGGEGNGTVTGATNGLSLVNSGTTVVLGGDLINNTVIYTNEKNLEFASDNANYNAYMRVCLTTGYTSVFAVHSECPTGNQYWDISGSYQGVQLRQATDNNNLSSLCICESCVILSNVCASVPQSVKLGQNALEYCGDYSVNYVSLSIPHVGWITGYTQSAITQSSNTVNVCNVTTTYSANTTNDFIGVSGATLIYLPQSPKPCQRISVADIKGVALTNNIIVCSEGKLINGNPTATINTDYGSITFINNGFTWSAVAFIN